LGEINTVKCRCCDLVTWTLINTTEWKLNYEICDDIRGCIISWTCDEGPRTSDMVFVDDIRGLNINDV